MVILSPIFVALLFVTAVDVGVVRTVSHPASVEKILSGSGIYNSLVPALTKQAGQSNGAGGQIDLTNPAIQQAVQQSFTPTLIQTDVNTALNSIYKWMDGTTTLPDFRIDLSGAKTAFATNVGAAAEARAKTLPACSTAFSSTNFDPFGDTCLPGVLTPAEVGTNAKDNILNGNGFLNDPVITANTVKTGNSGKSIFADQLKNVPVNYQRAKKTPIAFSVLTILLAVAIVFLYSSRSKGLRHIGITLLGVGILMLAVSWGLNKVVSTNLAPNIKITNTVLQDKVRVLVVDLAQAVDKNLWTFGGLYSILGAGAIATPIIIKLRGGGSKKPPKSTPVAEPNDSPEPIVPTEPEPSQPAEHTKPPAKKIRIIQ